MSQLGDWTNPRAVGTLPCGLARRAHHASSGRALPWILIGLLVAVGLGTGAFFLLRGDGDGKAEEPPVGPFTFEVGDVSSVPVGESARGTALDKARGAVADLMGRLYTTAFVDPTAWKGGAFPDLPSYFAGPAAKRTGRDLDDLSLGSEAKNIERVEPSSGELTLTFLIDPDRQPYAAIAETTFEATGRAVGGKPVSISQTGRYVVRLESGEWRIVGYEVEGAIDSGSPQPGASP